MITHLIDGKPVDAVAQVTKSGHVFVFDRETGEPLFPIEERIVPPSDLQGESAWPTQPLLYVAVVGPGDLPNTVNLPWAAR